MEKMPDGSVVILAFDLDDGGEKLVEEVKAFVPAGRKVRRMVPDVGTGQGLERDAEKPARLT